MVDRKVLDIVRRHHAEPLKVCHTLQEYTQHDLAEVADLLWALHDARHIDATDQVYLHYLDDSAPGSVRGSSLSSLIWSLASGPKMHNIRELLEACPNRTPVWSLIPALSEPWQHYLRFLRAGLGDDTDPLGDETRAAMAIHVRGGTDTDFFEAIWPGEEGGRALAWAASQPGASHGIYGNEVFDAAKDWGSPREIAGMVFNTCTWTAIEPMAETLSPPSPALVDALVESEVGLSDHGRFATMLASVLIARGGRTERIEEWLRYALTFATSFPYCTMMSEALSHLDDHVRIDIMMGIFGPSGCFPQHDMGMWSIEERGEWALLIDNTLPPVLDAALATIPTDVPIVGSNIDKAFRRMPREAGPRLATITSTVPNIRYALAQGQASAGGPEAWRRLIELLDDRNKTLRESAAESLTDPEALETVAAALHSPRNRTRRRVAEVLLRHEGAGEIARAALKTESDPRTRALLERASQLRP